MLAGSGWLAPKSRFRWKNGCAASWFHDGSAQGPKKLGCGKRLVISGIVVKVPMLSRPVCLPVAARLAFKDITSAVVERDGDPREAARSGYAMSVGCRAARTDDHRQVRTGAVCGPPQRTKRRATTRRDTDQRRVFPLAAPFSGL
jgi:hypothetical protein